MGRQLFLLAAALLLATTTTAFINTSPTSCHFSSLLANHPHKIPFMVLHSTSNHQDQELLPIASMRLKEIKAELQDRQVAYGDCFDKESLAKRLEEARDGTAAVQIQAQKQSTEVVEETNNSNGQSYYDRNNSNNKNNNVADDGEIIPEVLEKGEQPQDYVRNDGSTIENEFDRDGQLAELRGMTVRQLREECSRRAIRWAQFVEKEDIVQALLKARSQVVRYAVAGHVQPGLVAELTAEELEAELAAPSEAPLLLDIYATWCGPCQMMAPQLKDAAFEFGTQVRVAKIDSDKYPEMAQKFRAGGLPTVLLLNGDQELSRIEGAMMKEQILNFVNPFIDC